MAPRRKEDSTRLRGQSQASPIERFFHSYSDFEHNPLKPLAEEYQRLRKLYGWRRGDVEGDRAWSGYRLALVKEFNRLFGTDPYHLLAWQTLCTFIGIRERFTTCDDCVRSLKSRHFNVVDVIDARRRGNGVAQVFPTKESLQEYTKTTASYFPYNDRKAGNLLRQLLRCNNTRRNWTQPPLYPPPYIQEGDHEAKDKVPRTSSNKAEARSTKKLRMIAESVEATITHSYVEFKSE